ncbi:Protein ral2 [Grifola frondosa]|uniref:Protein ral2 n=1 Tax=Grifola frondosa TaxID=5627 RepID=A0A1C7M4T6_GRIFR|nr:Protein ral2 [Grifola frondosa]
MYPISDLTAFCRSTTGDVPPKLVGASTTVVGSKMYLYGGRLVSERRMVSDIYMFDLESFNWERLVQSPEDDIPQARYFHSADTWKNNLIVFGGMAIKPQSDNPEDLCVLNDVRMFDLNTKHWLPSVPIPSDSSLVPNARYAHLSSVTADRLFVIGGQDLANVCRFKAENTPSAPAPATPSQSLVHMSYSAPPTDDYPCDIFLFSNYNFTDVQRELEVFTPLSDGDFTVADRSASMTGTSLPPGLRFPTGAILGTYFLVAGTYLSQTYQSFSIWALDLINMTWSRIDPGSALSSGSWFRSCLWPAANKFVVFGNRHGNLVEDYNRRLLSWDHVTCIDLEAFGIYQPPALVLDLPMQELGLAALEEGVLSDFEIVCDDGRRIKCSRKLLEDRWPWFKQQRLIFLKAAQRAIETAPQVSQNGPSVTVPGPFPDAEDSGVRPDPRLTPRSFNLSEPYPITLALLQYFYSMALITPLQHAPAVLSQLLLLSSTYGLTHLQSLVKHAMHRALSYATSVGIYGVSTLCSCRSLQIRALRVVMAYSQRRPAGVRTRADGPPGGGRSDSNGGSGGGHGPGGRGLEPPSAARPRGMSDASFMRGPDVTGPGSNRAFARANGTDLSTMQQFELPGPIRSRATSDGSLPTMLSLPLPPNFLLGENASNGVPGPPRRTTSMSALPKATTPLTVSKKPTAQSTRRFSVISLSTDQDICAIAELLSPVVDVGPSFNEEERTVAALPEELEPIPDLAHEEPHARDSYDPLSPSSVRSSLYSVSDGASQSDEFGESVLLSLGHGSFPTFHLPRSTQRIPSWDSSDSRSLSSTASYSSLSTPSLSRASSFQLPGSPPISPTSSYLSTPIDSFPSFPPPPKQLDVIEESLGLEDHELRRIPSDDAQTVNIPLSTPSKSLPEDHIFVHGRERNSGRGTPVARMPSLERLKIDVMPSSPATPYSHGQPPASPVLSGSSSGSSIRSPKPGSGAFSRLFSKDGKKSNKNDQSPGIGDFADFSASALDLGLSKAEEKKRKREAARERTERLAQDLAAKSKQRAAAILAERQARAGKKGNRPWEEEGGMFNGINYLM